MALVAHRNVRHSAAGRVVSLVGGGLSLLLFSGCNSGPGKDPEPLPTASASSSSPDSHFRKLEKQAMEAVDHESVEDAGFLAAGSEKLVDGIHARPPLDAGESYQLAVVCAGTGKARMALQYGDVERRETLTCDGVPSYWRISDAPEQLTLDVGAAANSTGAAAWRISRVRL
jgi:hypothetical protein